MTANPVKPSLSSGGVRMTPKDFVQENVVAPAGARVIIAQLSPHFFRVKMCKMIESKDSIVKVARYFDERVYEVVDGVDGYSLADRTVNK